MKKVIDDGIIGIRNEVMVPQTQFRVNPFLGVTSREMNKRYRFVYDKRRILEEYHTVPFGWVDFNQE